MSIVFTNAKLIDPEEGTEKVGSLAVIDGLIADVSYDSALELRDAEQIDCGDLCLAPGLIDIGVKICEPGERHKESFRSAGRAAAAGGVTTMVTRPDTLPAIDTPETLEFQSRRGSEAAPVHVAPMAALTKGRSGREMVEIGFLKDAGAVAFTDCDR
ncbi:MAG: dihydroorotase, partial [Pseudomonadota bacterium]